MPRHLLLGRKVMTNLDSIFKKRDITFKWGEAIRRLPLSHGSHGDSSSRTTRQQKGLGAQTIAATGRTKTKGAVTHPWASGIWCTALAGPQRGDSRPSVMDGAVLPNIWLPHQAILEEKNLLMIYLSLDPNLDLHTNTKHYLHSFNILHWTLKIHIT